MWSLLPTPLRKRLFFWVQLVLLVIVWHLLLLWLVIGYRGSLYQHHLIIDTFHFNKDIPTVVMPLVKNITNAARVRATGSAQSVNQSSKENGVKEKQDIKKTSTENSKKSSDPVVAVPLVAPIKNKKIKADTKKKEKQTAAATPAIKKEAPIKKEVELPKQVGQAIVPAGEKKKDDLSSLSSTTTQQLPDEGAVIFIGREDAQAQQLYDAVYEAVRIVWAPPPGFGADVKAHVEIILNWDGSLQKYTLLQSSGVPLFDACVRRDSKKIVFPRGAWGKTWILTFSNDTKVSYE